MRIINTSQFVDEICSNCYRCGSEKYDKIIVNGYLFKLCKKCQKNHEVITHLKKIELTVVEK